MDLGVLKRFVDTVLNKPSVSVIIKNPAQSGGDKPRAGGSPDKPYATVNFLSRSGRGFAASEIIPQGVPVTSVNQLVSKQKIAQCEVIFYSNDTLGEFSAEELAEYFETALGFDRSRNFQITNSFGVMQIRPAQDITLILADLIERRVIVEFSINYVHEITETSVDYFNSVETILTVEV